MYCVGDNIIKYPYLYDKIVVDGHAIASHTMSHLRGYTTPSKQYFDEVMLFKKKFQSNIFRPPFGQVTIPQLWRLHRAGIRIIIWSFDTEDWIHNENENIEPVLCQREIKSGDIILMHFCSKHSLNTKQILPIVLKQIKDRGFQTGVLS